VRSYLFLRFLQVKVWRANRAQRKWFSNHSFVISGFLSMYCCSSLRVSMRDEAKQAIYVSGFSEYLLLLMLYVLDIRRSVASLADR